MYDDWLTAVLADTPIALWPMQEGSGNFLDEVASADLTVAGTITYGNAGPGSGSLSAHLAANAYGQTLAIGPDDAQDQDYGVGLWLRPDALSGGIFRTGNPFLTGDIAADKYRVVQQGVNNNSTAASLVIDTWYYLLWSRDGGSNRTYINGVLDTNFGVGSPSFQGVTRTDIGHDGGSTCAGYYMGAVLFDYGITAEQALAHYEAMMLPPPPSGGIPRADASVGHGRWYG